MAKAKQAAPRAVRCYLCGRVFEVSVRAMSTACPGCHKAIKIEDVVVKTYVPVTALQTCGAIEVTKKGRVAAKVVQSGATVECAGTIEGSIEAQGQVHLAAGCTWRGDHLAAPSLVIEDGARVQGRVIVGEVERREPA